VSSRVRRLLRRAAGRWVGERLLPVGAVALDRRLLRRALPPSSLGRVLVVGSSLATRQAWPEASVDVVGTSPYAREVTVCSHLDGPASLPEARWDTVVVTQVGEDLAERLRVLRPACRPQARLVLLERNGRADLTGTAAALREVAVLRQVHLRHSRRLWIAQVRR
jgi:hypothetical protein